MKEFFVYVIKNQINTLYTGVTKDIGRRIKLHNSGKGAKFTRGRGFWQLTYSEGPFEHGDALRREMEIKKDKTLKQRLKSYNN
jgi:putative endonuclease